MVSTKVAVEVKIPNIADSETRKGTKQGRLTKWQDSPHLCTQLAFITEHEETEFLELEKNKKNVIYCFFIG